MITKPTPARLASRLALTAAVAATTVLASARTASAEVVQYVDLVTYRDTIDSCAQGQALPCTPNAGSGQSNRLRILQVPTAGGLVYGSYDTTSLAADRLWLAATLAAECKPARRLSSALIELGYRNASGGVNDPQGLSPTDWSTPISVPHAKTMPTKKVALNVPVDDAFSTDVDGTPLVAGFPTLASVYDHGEAVIAARVAGGVNEATARSLPIVVNTTVATSATIRCENLSGSKSTWKQRGRHLPLTIEFVAVPVPPVDRPPVDDLTAPPEVTHVELDVQVDPFDECKLRLYGRVETNRAMTVRYRFIRPDGTPTRLFKLFVDDSRVGYISWTAPIPMAGAAPPADGGAGTGAGGDTLVGEPDDGRYTGAFILRVTQPNRVSAADGFAVDFCTPQGPTGEGS